MKLLPRGESEKRGRAMRHDWPIAFSFSLRTWRDPPPPAYKSICAPPWTVIGIKDCPAGSTNSCRLCRPCRLRRSGCAEWTDIVMLIFLQCMGSSAHEFFSENLKQRKVRNAEEKYIKKNRISLTMLNSDEKRVSLTGWDWARYAIAKVHVFLIRKNKRRQMKNRWISGEPCNRAEVKGHEIEIMETQRSLSLNGSVFFLFLPRCPERDSPISIWCLPLLIITPHYPLIHWRRETVRYILRLAMSFLHELLCSDELRVDLPFRIFSFF